MELHLKYPWCIALTVSSLDKAACFNSGQQGFGCFLSMCTSQPLFEGTLLFDSTFLSLLESLKNRHLQKRTVLQTWSAAWSLGTPSPGHTWFQRILGARVPGNEVALLMLKAWVEQDALEGWLLWNRFRFCRAGYTVSVCICRHPPREEHHHQLR